MIIFNERMKIAEKLDRHCHQSRCFVEEKGFEKPPPPRYLWPLSNVVLDGCGKEMCVRFGVTGVTVISCLASCPTSFFLANPEARHATKLLSIRSNEGPDCKCVESFTTDIEPSCARSMTLAQPPSPASAEKSHKLHVIVAASGVIVS